MCGQDGLQSRPFNNTHDRASGQHPWFRRRRRPPQGRNTDTSGTRVTTFRRDLALYEANAGSDRDKDGIACAEASDGSASLAAGAVAVPVEVGGVARVTAMDRAAPAARAASQLSKYAAGSRRAPGDRDR